MAAGERIFRTKSLEWSYEQEVRTLRFASQIGYQGEYFEYPGTLTGVYFGLHASDNFIRDINRLLSNDTKVLFYKSEFSGDEYDISFRQMNRANIN